MNFWQLAPYQKLILIKILEEYCRGYEDFGKNSMEIAIEKRSRLDRKASQKSARKMPPLTIKSIKCKTSNQREGETIFWVIYT